MARVGNDVLGRALLEDLRAEGVRAAVSLSERATGLVQSIADQTGERTMFTYRGTSATLREGDLDFDLLSRAEWLHVVGHAFLESASREAALAAIRHVKGHGGWVSLDPSSYRIVEEMGQDEFFALTEDVDVLFPNRAEAAALTGTDEAAQMLHALAGRYAMPVIKLGADGAMAAYQGRVASAPAPAVTPVDTTGAGDAFAAAYVVRWLATRGVARALGSAVALATQVIRRPGSRAMAGPLPL